jgi:crossover junction endodeoxyribonuclease RusA
MKLVAKFTVRGNPVSKERPRVESGRARTTEKTIAAEDRVRWAFLEQCKGTEVDSRARFRVMLAFVATDRRGRDIDNLAKLVLDALNGLAWKDDQQVDELSVRRVFVKDKTLGRTDVEIYKIGEE